MSNWRDSVNATTVEKEGFHLTVFHTSKYGKKLSFASLTPHEDVVDAFGELLVRVGKEDEHKYCSFMPAKMLERNTLSHAKSNEKVVEKLRSLGATPEEIATTLLHRFVSAGVVEEDLARARDHLQMFAGKSFKLRSEGRAIVNPAFAQWGVDFLNLLFLLDPPGRLVKECDDEEVRDFLKAYYKLLNEHSYGSSPKRDSAGKTVGDIMAESEGTYTFPWASPPHKFHGTSVTAFPLQHKKFRDYLLALPLKELLLLTDRLNYGLGEEEAIASAEEIISPTRESKTTRFLERVTLYHSLLAHHSQVDDLRLWETLLASFTEGEERVNCLKTFSEYLLSFSSGQVNARYAHDLHAVLTGAYIKQWLVNPKMVNYVVGQLREKLGAVATVEVILEVRKTRSPLGYKQWEKIINTCDQYKDTPASWWVPLVK